MNKIQSERGLTLVELVMVLFLMTLSVFLVAQTFGNNLDQKRYERTLEGMREIKRAILGTYSERVRGDIRFAGYIEDMGDLPGLINGQPKGLWERGDLPLYRGYSMGGLGEIGRLTIYLGWRGPYLKPPAGGILKDGWGNPFIFERHGNNFIIKSLGADGHKGGDSYDQDIVLAIRGRDWLGTVAGYISPYSVLKTREEAQREKCKFPGPDVTRPSKVIVRLFYRPCENGVCKRSEKDDLKNYLGDFVAIQYMSMEIDPTDGYFYFEHVPLGTERLLIVAQPIMIWHKPTYGPSLIKQPYNLDVEPGLNWMGNMGVIP